MTPHSIAFVVVVACALAALPPARGAGGDAAPGARPETRPARPARDVEATERPPAPKGAVPTVPAAPPTPPALRLTPRRPGDALEARAEGGGVVVTVSSTTGIGGAVLARAGGAWPDPLVLRLKLKGLESLKFSAGGVTWSASASPAAAGGQRLHLGRDGEEGTPLEKGSVYWVEVRRLDADGKPAAELPAAGGCFEVVVPKALLGEKAAELTVEWIDFYRG